MGQPNHALIQLLKITTHSSRKVTQNICFPHAIARYRGVMTNLDNNFTKVIKDEDNIFLSIENDIYFSKPPHD